MSFEKPPEADLNDVCFTVEKAEEAIVGIVRTLELTNKQLSLINKQLMDINSTIEFYLKRGNRNG